MNPWFSRFVWRQKGTFFMAYFNGTPYQAIGCMPRSRRVRDPKFDELYLSSIFQTATTTPKIGWLCALCVSSGRFYFTKIEALSRNGERFYVLEYDLDMGKISPQK
jgi:hypothetical protein